MSFFKHVEGEAAILVENGVYRQVDLYTRDGYLYAKSSGGFVRLKADGSTTKAKLRLEHMSWTGGLYRDTFGSLATHEARLASDKIKPLEAERQQLLLGSPT